MEQQARLRSRFAAGLRPKWSNSSSADCFALQTMSILERGAVAALGLRLVTRRGPLLVVALPRGNSTLRP